MCHRLCRNVVEVDQVSHCVQNGEKEGGAGADLVELNVGVQGDVLVQRHLLHLGDQVPAHGQQQEAVAERQGGRRTASEGDTHTHHVTKVKVLSHKRVDLKKMKSH